MKYHRNAMKNYNRFAEFNRNRCKVPDAIDAIYQRFQGPKTNLNKPKCIKYRECPPLCNPEDDDDDGDKSDFSCECIISVDAIQKRLQTILKNSKYIHDCRGDEKILECIDLCNDREERLRKLYEKYNEKYQHDIETQKAKLLALSQPKQKLSPWDVQKHPFTVRKSALTYKCTPRMLKIAQVNPKNITHKYRPPSVPKYSMKELKERQKKWKALLKEQRGKKKTHSRKKLKKKKKKSTVASEKKKKVLDEMYARLAEPKKLFKDPTPEKKPPKPYAEIMQRTRELLALAKPPEPRIDIDEFFKPKLVPEGYQPSPRLLELAKPRELPEEYLLNQNYEWKIKQSALDYVPTERILKLAVPKIRKDPEPDFDPDAFKVKKSALRYKPSKRILELAKPRVYPE